MKKSIFLTLIVVVVSVTSYHNLFGYVISGEITGIPDKTMIYLSNKSTDETFDSTMVINGKFRLSGILTEEPEEISFYSIVGEKYIHKYLIIGNENITVKADINDFPWDAMFLGSKTQNDVNYLTNLSKPYILKRNALSESMFKLSPEEQQENEISIWNEIKILDDSTDAINMRFLKSHINTYYGMIQLGSLKYSLPKDTVRKLYNKLSDKLKANKKAKGIEIFLKEKIAEQGDKFHDFTAFDKNGNLVRLSNIKGKYILLDFTAAYCGPCIESATELRLIDQTYSDSLEIISFSGDKKKDIWLNSLVRDSVTWISLWDGKGIDSETSIKYGIQAFPIFFLIDPNGIIINKWSGYGEGTLEKQLSRFKKE